MTTDSATGNAADFEPHRRWMRALAYRMLGSRAEAEDVVQDAWLRWSAVDHEQVGNARAYLSQTVTRLCLDRLKSAQAQREVYVGNWLPEPVVDDEHGFQPGPDAALELASDLSFAFMLTLERLSPLERAAFLLHDVFDLPFGEIALALGRSAAACRQLAARARANVHADRPRMKVLPEDEQRIVGAFVAALRDGDIDTLTRVLADDARFVSDGGGKVESVPKPLVGNVLIAKVMHKFAQRDDAQFHRVRAARVNGLPGCVISTIDGKTVQTMAFELQAPGRIAAVYIVRNPDKLRLVAP